MKIGVSGASGKLGQGVLRELAARAQGHTIVAISRTPEKDGSGVEGRLGDYDQPETLAQAYAGLDRLLLIPTSDQRHGHPSSGSGGREAHRLHVGRRYPRAGGAEHRRLLLGR